MAAHAELVDDGPISSQDIAEARAFARGRRIRAFLAVALVVLSALYALVRAQPPPDLQEDADSTARRTQVGAYTFLVGDRGIQVEKGGRVVAKSQVLSVRSDNR